MKVVSVVLGTYNRLGFLKIAIESIRRELQLYAADVEIIVVDGGSTDGSLGWLARQKDILTIIQHNRGEFRGQPIKRRSWGYFMNLGFRCAQGKYICMLSDDCLVIPGAIRNGVALFEERLANGEKVGAVAFYWRNWPEQQSYQVGLTLGDKLFVNHGLYLKEALDDVDYCDENSYFFYHADGDLCLKMWQAGYSCIDSSDSFIEHYSHANLQVRQSNVVTADDDWENYLKRWDGTFYVPGMTSKGSWIQKQYVDANETAKKFKNVEKYGLNTKRGMQKISSMIRRFLSGAVHFDN